MYPASPAMVRLFECNELQPTIPGSNSLRSNCQSIEQRNTWTLSRNIVIYDELDKILVALAGIKVVLLSGAALARTVYPDISQRPMSDIDLLLTPKDLPLVEAQLTKSGYVLEMRRQDEVHYRTDSPDFTIHIDLHTRLPWFEGDDCASLISRACIANLAGVPAYILCPEDTLIHIAADAVIGHNRITETVMNDISNLLSKYADCEVSPPTGVSYDRPERGLDWTILIKRVKRYRLEAPLYYLLTLLWQFERSELLPGMVGCNSLHSNSRTIIKPDLIPNDVIKQLKPSGIGALQLLFYRYFLTLSVVGCVSRRSGSKSRSSGRGTTYRSGMVGTEFIPPSAGLSLRNGRDNGSDDLAPVMRFLTQPNRLRLLSDSFMPSPDFMARRYQLSSRFMALLFYPIRFLSHFWRVSKVAAQTVRGLVAVGTHSLHSV